jgi:steroid delta-isomerase-like uncharacterized protein
MPGAEMTVPGAESNARLALVEEHVRAENRHDLDAIMGTFGASARYDDEPWADHRGGRAGVQTYYTELLRALPDLVIEINRRHVAAESIVLEVAIRGTHLGGWRGLPATGRKVDFPLCGIFTFDADGRLAGERIYYDRATVLQQLGIFRDPATLLGRLFTALTHPLTIARAYCRGLLRRRAVPPASRSHEQKIGDTKASDQRAT